MDDAELEAITAIEPAAVALARQASHFDDILSRLETDIVPQKAKSILVNRGSDRAAKALTAYGGVLKMSEKAAKEKESEWRTKVETARNELNDFVDRANRIVKRSVLEEGLDSKANSLAGTILDLVIGDRLVTDLSYHLAESVANAGFHLSSEKLVRTIERDIAPKFTGALKGALSRALEQWRKGNGVNQLRTSLESVCNDIHELWKERKINAVEMLDGFEPPTVPEEDIGDLCDDLSNVLLENRQVSDIVHRATDFKAFFLNMFKNLWDFILRVWAELAKTILSDPTAPARIKFAIGQQRTALIGKMATKFRTGIEDSINDIRFQDKIRQPLKDQLCLGIMGIRQKLISRLDSLTTDFESERVRKPENQFGKSLEERQRIAETNRAIRTGTIEPLRKRIEAFAATVMTELAG